MATSDNHVVLLDQLQAQVNQVLEHTGRVFAAMNANPKERPVAQIAKLQSVLPVAEHRFHDALDELEDELQLTMLVMRRDLAACRARSGQQTRNYTVKTTPALANNAAAEPGDGDVEMVDTKERPQEQPADAKPVEIPAPTAERSPSTEDVTMEDAKPSIPEAQENAQDAKPSQASTEQPVDTKPYTPEDNDVKPASDDAKPGNLEIQTDAKITSEEDQDGKAPDDEKAPDTAVETNNDLDSLFNDETMSVGGMANETSDFNFDDFAQIDPGNGADHDNIASLLPGLEDYANNQSNEVNLDELFNLNGTDDTNGMDTQGAGEQGDSFEDLLAGLDDNTVDDNQNTTANQDFDFDSLFS